MSAVRAPETGRSGPLLLVSVSLLVAALLVLLAVRLTGDDAASDPDAGATEDGEERRAVCDPVRGEPATDNSHVDDRELRYPAPPASGDHSGRWAVLARPFYTVADRPEASVLVHNLEHGYNVLWYDETVVDDAEALAQVQVIAEGYAGSGRDPADAFIAAPWTAADGGPMPDDRHYALTHWYADPDSRSRSRDDEVGYTMYCSSVTTGLVRRWMAAYPLRDAPEGYPINM